MLYKVNELKKNKHKTKHMSLFFTVPATQEKKKS